MLRNKFNNAAVALCRRVLLVFILILLVFAPLYYGAVEDWHVAVLAGISILIFLVWSVSNLLSKEPETKKTRLSKSHLTVYVFAALFAALIAVQLLPVSDGLLGIVSPARSAFNDMTGVVGNATLSVAPHTTGLWLLRTTGLILVFVVVSHAFTQRKHVFSIAALIVILGYLNAVYGLLQYLSDNSLPSLFVRTFHVDRAAGTYVNSNHFAGYLEMCTPVGLAIIFMKRTQRGQSNLPFGRRVVNFISEKLQDRKFLLPLTAVIVMSLAIVFSMSRMGIFSFAFSLVFFGLLIGRRHAKKLRLTILGSVTVVILAVSIWMGVDPVMKRYSLLSEGALKRVEAWKMTGGIIRDYPLLGTGLGTFMHVSPAYQSSYAEKGHWLESHNDYLNLISDTGITGFLLAMGFMLAWYIYVFRLLTKKHIRTYQKALAVGCITGVTSILVHSIADFNLQIPANALYFAVLMGLAIAALRIRDPQVYPQKSEEKQEEIKAGKLPESFISRPLAGRMAPFLAAITLAVLLIPMALNIIRAENCFERSKNIKKTENRIEALNTCILLDKNNPEYYFTLGKIVYRTGKDYPRARELFTETVRLAPYVGKYHYRLGMTCARLGDIDASEKEFALAMQLAPVHPDLHYKIAYFHFFRWRRTGNADILSRAFTEFRNAAQISGEYLSLSLDLVSKYIPQYESLQYLVPPGPDYHRAFANYLASNQRWRDALAEYRRTWRLITQEDPSYRGDEFLVLALSRCYLMTGNVDDARRGYLKALNLTNDKRMVFQAIRHNFVNAGRAGEAAVFLQNLKADFPNNDFLLLEIAKAYYAAGNLAAAQEIFFELSDLRPSIEVFRYLFAIAMHRRDFDLAEIHANAAIRYDRAEARNYSMLARAREGAGDYEGAARAVKQALAIDPQNKTYKDLFDRVSERLIFKKK